MSQFSINPELSAELLGQINSGLFDRGIFAIPGDAIRPGASARLLGERVQPGDLITADLINFILARLDALESRPVPTAPTTPTIPTVTFVPTFPTFPTLTFPTIFTMNPTIFTQPTGLGPSFTFPTGIFTQPTGLGPGFTFPTGILTQPTGFGPVFTFVPSVTMGPMGPVLTVGPAFTMPGPGNVATGLNTMDPGLATNFGGINPGAVATAPGGNLFGGAIRREERVTVLPGVGREEETRLTNAGFRNLGEVADADITALGTALGVEPAEAARVVGVARGALGRPR